MVLGGAMGADCKESLHRRQPRDNEQRCGKPMGGWMKSVSWKVPRTEQQFVEFALRLIEITTSSIRSPILGQLRACIAAKRDVDRSHASPCSTPEPASP